MYLVRRHRGRNHGEVDEVPVEADEGAVLEVEASVHVTSVDRVSQGEEGPRPSAGGRPQLLQHFLQEGTVHSSCKAVQGSAKKVVPKLRECCRQSQADVVSKSSNKFHQTCGPLFSRAL